MQSRDFVFWLQGFFELTPCGPISAEQAALIKAHLGLVFQHDPSIPKAQMTHPAPATSIVRTPAPHPDDWRKQMDAYQGVSVPNFPAVSVC